MDLKYAEIQEGEHNYINCAKITKEDAFEIILENSLRTIEEGSVSEHCDKFSFPQNFKEVVKNLLGRDKVYCTLLPSPDHFVDNKWVKELTTLSFRSQEINGFAKKVNEFLLKDATIYIYSYYVMTVDKYVDDDLTIPEPWFWYRIAIKFGE